MQNDTHAKPRKTKLLIELRAWLKTSFRNARPKPLNHVHELENWTSVQVPSTDTFSSRTLSALPRWTEKLCCWLSEKYSKCSHMTSFSLLPAIFFDEFCWLIMSTWGRYSKCVFVLIFQAVSLLRTEFRLVNSYVIFYILKTKYKFIHAWSCINF